MRTPPPWSPPSGLLAIAIYNDQGWKSRAWRAVKAAYCRTPGALRPLLFSPVAILFELRWMAGDLVRGRSPRSRWRSAARGMNPWHDWIDWLGGYPFEVATPEAVFDFFHAKGFRLERLTTCMGGLREQRIHLQPGQPPAPTSPLMPNPVKVCFVGFYAWPLFRPAATGEIGGAEVQLYTLARELARDSGFRVDFIVRDENGGSETIDGVTVHKLSLLQKTRASDDKSRMPPGCGASCARSARTSSCSGRQVPRRRSSASTARSTGSASPT